MPLRAAQQQAKRARLDAALAIYVRDLIAQTQEGQAEAQDAIEALICLGPRGVEHILCEVQELAGQPGTAAKRSCLAYVLGRIGDARAVDALAVLLSDTVVSVCRNAEAALRDIGDTRARSVLTAAGFRE